MTTKVHIKELHSEITEWKSQVALVLDEVKIFKTHLGLILSKNTSGEVAAQAEHFQNQLRRNEEAFDDLSDELLLADEALGIKAGSNGSADHILLDKNPVLEDKIKTALHIFTEFKQEFHAFEEKWY